MLLTVNQSICQSLRLQILFFKKVRYLELFTRLQPGLHTEIVTLILLDSLVKSPISKILEKQMFCIRIFFVVVLYSVQIIVQCNFNKQQISLSLYLYFFTVYD